MATVNFLRHSHIAVELAQYSTSIRLRNMLNIQDMVNNNGLVADELFDFDYSSDFVSDWASTEWQGKNLKGLYS